MTKHKYKLGQHVRCIRFSLFGPSTPRGGTITKLIEGTDRTGPVYWFRRDGAQGEGTPMLERELEVMDPGPRGSAKGIDASEGR